MSGRQVEQLVKMAQQIAVNLGVGRDAAAARRTAEHLGRFWTPAVRARLLAFWRGGGEVSAEVAMVLRELDGQQDEGAS